MGQLIIIVAMFVLLWLLLIRPQRRRQLEQQELQSSIDVGDEILTHAGIYGHVRELLEDDDIRVEIAPGTYVRMARRAVAGVVEVEDEPAPELDEEAVGEVDALEPADELDEPREAAPAPGTAAHPRE